MKVAQAALQGRSLVNRAASSQREARICYARASGADPDRGLRSLDQKRFVIQCSRQRMIPVARGLGLQQGPRRAEIGANPAEFILECLRIGVAA